jgi:quercetin 2,3-dioxygenase
MRTIRKIHKAQYSPIADLETWSPLPTSTLRYIDPFLFLNHHGPQVYRKHNNGLPFGPHPHRGMETVTFILDGDILHRDNAGHESVINAGGVQWMTAGRGLIHAEVSSPAFKEHGGPLEILQLWVNLPARLKMTEPRYTGLPKEEIPNIQLPQNAGSVDVISGEFNHVSGPFDSLSNVSLFLLRLNDKGSIILDPPQENNLFFYIIKGEVYINSTLVRALHLVEFNKDGSVVNVSAGSESIILYGYAKPFNEPVVAQGPFVMNSREEILQAYQDYRDGKFGPPMV